VFTHEALEKFLADIERQIDDADKINKQNAEDTLKAVAKYYQQRVAERITAELLLSDECRKIGDDVGAKHHSTLADVYKSLFNVHANV
jgi:predicted DNA repair protein MutK